ncbi:MAG: adenylate/guanylate cyclase domain-containing protein [Gemmatimonadaceae bacterium]
MPFRLLSNDGAHSFELGDGQSLIVGRAVTSDIPLLDPTISRRHAEIKVTNKGLLIQDLGSSNGTFLNGARVEAARAGAGDLVTFGKVAFRLSEVAKRPPSVTPEHETIVPTPIKSTGAATIVRQLPMRDVRGPLTAVIQGVDPSAAQPLGAPYDDRDLNERKLALLLEVSKGLSRAIDIDALLDKIAGFVFQIMDVDRVAIMLLDGGELQPKISRDRQGAVTARAVPQSIARRVVDEKVAVLSDNAPEDQRFGGQSIVMQSVRSAMCAPLIGSEDSVLGVLYVDNLTATHRFGDVDLDFLIAFSGIAAVAIENSAFAERIRRETLVRSNFERYFAPSLAARIANAPDSVKLGGDKQPVAVLFSDIRGFTALSENMTPEEVARLLSEYFSVMVDCVFRHDGTLDKFIGDAVMAQWGAPLGTPDDADRAMRAALDMMRELETLNQTWRTQERPELEIGIGLNYGESFAGNIGSERRLEYTVIGDTVNIASRLCAAAGGGEILLTEDFRSRLRDHPPLREGAFLEVKGKSQPVRAYSVVLGATNK